MGRVILGSCSSNSETMGVRCDLKNVFDLAAVQQGRRKDDRMDVKNRGDNWPLVRLLSVSAITGGWLTMVGRTYLSVEHNGENVNGWAQVLTHFGVASVPINQLSLNRSNTWTCATGKPISGGWSRAGVVGFRRTWRRWCAVLLHRVSLPLLPSALRPPPSSVSGKHEEHLASPLIHNNIPLAMLSNIRSFKYLMNSNTTITSIKEILKKGKEDGHGSEGLSVDMEHEIEELTKENIWNFKNERNKS
ncbi:hypothetical protein CBL_01342 [Carabus blaptoides fortunei]